MTFHNPRMGKTPQLYRTFANLATQKQSYQLSYNLFTTTPSISRTCQLKLLIQYNLKRHVTKKYMRVSALGDRTL